jgi:hypothetical protein
MFDRINMNAVLQLLLEGIVYYVIYIIGTYIITALGLPGMLATLLAIILAVLFLIRLVKFVESTR